MHKARAMLDALMGPGRDVLEKDQKSNKKEKFKDRTCCKGFLIGFCPLDSSVLGGKRKFAICAKIHSELMRDQLKQHPDVENLTRDYESLSLQDLEFCVRECESHITAERQRIREDVRRKKPPLPPAVNDKLAQMKRESSAMIQKAETLEDSEMREKERLITQSNELLKEREEYLEAETKKAIEAQTPEEVCEICGTSFLGQDGDAAHLKFRIHDAYVKIRARIEELKPRIEEWQKAKNDKKAEEAKKKRKEEWDKAAEKEGRKSKKDKKDKEDKEGKEDQDKDKDKDKDKEKDGEGDKADKADKADGEEKGEKGEKGASKSKGRSKEGSKEREKNGKEKRGRDRSRSRSGGRRKGRSRSRSRGRKDRSGSRSRRGGRRDRDRSGSRGRGRGRRGRSRS